MAICAALDAFIDEEVPWTKSKGIEILIRRLGGVQQADEGKSWSVATALALHNPTLSLVPRAALGTALKIANLSDKLQKAGKPTTSNKKAASASSSSSSSSTGWRPRSGPRGGQSSSAGTITPRT
jgi:hypothetical protein